MNIKFLTEDLRVSHRKFAAAILLISGTLAWFFLLAWVYLTEILETITLDNPFWGYYNIGQILFFGFAVFWVIVGSLISKRINRRKLLLSWISLGVLTTILLAVFQGTIFSIIAFYLLGLSFGLGLPSSMAFIADSTVVEERARVSGAIILVTFVIAFTVIAIARTLSLGIIGVIFLLTITRSISFSALFLDKFDNRQEKNELPRIPTAYKEFLFYLFPWVMFSVAAGIAWNLIPQTTDYANAISFGTPVRYVCIAVFGLVSGIAADRFGRRWPIIIGLIILGLSFALLGFNFNPNSVFIYLIISGIAWGSFSVVFLAIPGDLSNSTTREKSYGLGYVLPLAIFCGWSIVPGGAIFANFSASSFCLILSVILFLLIIPVFRAQETLTAQKIRERKMKEHVDKIGKLVQEAKERNKIEP